MTRSENGSESDFNSERDENENLEEDEAQREAPEAVSWEEFWRRCTAEHDQAMRDAGKNPDKPWEPSEGKHGEKIAFGVPIDGNLLCFGCGTACSDRYECCQCLEIYRDRAKRAAHDDWQRAFYCSLDCYKDDWENHKELHGPSKAGPSKFDSRIHEFDAAKGFGAVWDKTNLKRLNFMKCVPIW